MIDGQKSKLTDECGHHCGVLTSGGTAVHVGHCACDECHKGQAPPSIEEPIKPDVKESVSE